MRDFGLIVITLSCFYSNTLAQLSQSKLIAENISPGYGAATAIDGEFAAVGSGCKVHVFRKIIDEWSPVETLPNLDDCGQQGSGAYVRFGVSIALEGNLLVIGAPGLSPQSGFGQAGAVYTYLWDGIAWTEAGMIQDDNPRSGDSFGTSVDLYKGRVLIGAPHNYLDDSRGFAYLYMRSGDNWIREAKLTVVDTPVIGHEVALGKDLLVAAGSNVAYVFEKIGQDWILQQTLAASIVADTIDYAKSISIDSGRIAIGAPRWDSPIQPGSIYLYSKQNNKWIEETRITPTHDDVFGLGASVLLRDNYLIAGATTISCSIPGSVEVFVQNNTGGWSFFHSLKSDTPESGKRFGHSIDFDGANLIIGAVGTAFTCGRIVYGESTVTFIGAQITGNEENDAVIHSESASISVFPIPSNSIINFKIEITQPGYSKLEIFDSLGRVIGVISRRYYDKGVYKEIWDGTGDADGIYFYRLEHNETQQSGILVLNH